MCLKKAVSIEVALGSLQTQKNFNNSPRSITNTTLGKKNHSNFLEKTCSAQESPVKTGEKSEKSTEEHSKTDFERMKEISSN